LNVSEDCHSPCRVRIKISSALVGLKPRTRYCTLLSVCSLRNFPHVDCISFLINNINLDARFWF
jgi:hypothetical protein